MKLVRLLAAVAAIGAATVLPTVEVDAAASRALIQGSGSSWSANAINQWIADVQPKGLQVVFTANGSAQGRKDFGYRTNDFAVSEIGFRGSDPITGESDTPQGRDFAYLPIVAGGTSFPYQIREKGELVRNLRLSGPTIVGIFTNKITDWSDPAITADNNGRQLAPLPIIPVVHSEGSGTTAHLTDWFDAEYPKEWRAYAGHAGFTEYYPRKGSMVAQSGSDGVMNFVSSNAANGAIGYDEYSYPLGKNYPVAKVGNAGGYFTLPSQYNVAVSLTRAKINGDKNSPDYLLQDLKDVYTFTDPRVYPLSSYSYGILPTGANDSKMTTAKRQTLADFLFYSICDGQKEMGPIGYSPLPINLVLAGFEQIHKLGEADPNVDMTDRDVKACNNPTFIAGQPERNHLADIAPLPQACDQRAQGPCSDGRAPSSRAAAATTGGSAAGATSSGRTSGRATTGNTTVAADGTVIDVNGNPVVDASGNPITEDLYLDERASADSPANLRPYDASWTSIAAPFAVLVFVLALAAPAAATRLAERRREIS